MKTYNLNNETLNAAVAQLNSMAVSYYKKGANGSHAAQCQSIGALSAILDKLAEVMGGQWLFGEDFHEDANEIVRFCQDIEQRAECLAELAEVDDLTIIYDALAGVRRWINKGTQTRKNFETAKKYGVHIHTVEVLRDIETLTPAEAAEKYSAEEIEKALILAKREEGIETAQDDENDRHEDNTPAQAEETATEAENKPQSRHNFEKVAKVAKATAQKLAGLAAFVLVLVVSFGSFFLLTCALGDAREAYEATAGQIPNYVAFPLIILSMFTVMLDLTIWVELNTIAALDRLHAFDCFGNSPMSRPGFHRLPFSVIGRIINEARN